MKWRVQGMRNGGASKIEGERYALEHAPHNNGAYLYKHIDPRTHGLDACVCSLVSATYANVHSTAPHLFLGRRGHARV